MSLSSSASSDKLYYDESLFVDGLAIRNYDPIGVSNRADEYLVRRCGKATRPICIGTAAAVNPVSPCTGVNIYTMSRRHRVVHRVYRLGKISVVGDARRAVPITIAEPAPNGVYDFNAELTPLEMAIMLKYYSMTLARREDDADAGSGVDDAGGLVQISSHLYHTVFAYFDHSDSFTDGSYRNALNWLDDELNDSVVQLPNRELVHRSRIVNVPDLTFFGPKATVQ